jgi:hypothetical protein
MGEKFLGDASAGERDGMGFAGAVGGGDFIEPGAGDGAGEIVGVGEGDEFEVFHRIGLGEWDGWDL